MYIEDLKFSLWADFIEGEYLDNEFRELIDKKIINGATSNPAIFKNAILNSSAYKTQLATLDALTPKEKYEAVAIFDIAKAADILNPLFESGNDGYVSIEVDPYLCDDTAATIAEGKRLFEAIKKENVMIKVPATTAGYSAMRELTSLGIPVNATLIFKKEQAIKCAEAFREGVAKYGESVATVISIFVSRVDRALDEELAKKGIEVAVSGIYNSADIYATIEAMRVQGCRALFASTGVKGDSLEPHYYIENLLAYNSVNTAPIDTIKAYVKAGNKESALPISQEKIAAHFKALESIGIDFDALLDAQISDGLEQFKEAFGDILKAL